MWVGAQGCRKKVWDQISTKTVRYHCMEVAYKQIYELAYFYSAQISQNEEFKKAEKF